MSDEPQITVPRYVYKSMERALRVAEDRAARAAAKASQLHETLDRLVVKDRQNGDDSDPPSE